MAFLEHTLARQEQEDRKFLDRHLQEQRKTDALGWVGNDWSLGLESLKIICDRKKCR